MDTFFYYLLLYFSGIQEITYSARANEGNEELPPEWASPYFGDESSSQQSKKKGGFKKVLKKIIYIVQQDILLG
jgi:hypothetical protein